MLFPVSANADDYGLETGYSKYLSNKEKIDNFLKNEEKQVVLKSAYDKLGQRILTPEYEVINKRIRQITAYNVGDIYQCAGDPCISANGENICIAIEKGYKRCAANFVPFGTRLEIEGYGQCIVTDRMNSRYTSRVDIAMPYDQKPEAKEFGLKSLEVRVLAMNQ
ncbi:MAG: hypothetical protein ABIG10_02755 [bacterium]